MALSTVGLAALRLLLLLLLAVPAVSEPTVLWSTITPWGGLKVEEEGDLRTLLFTSGAGETVESQMSISQPWRLQLRYTRQMMAAVALWESRGQRVEAPRFLLVGLGGASLSKAVARQFPTASVTSVEIEPLVVEVARRYFDYREDDRVTTVVDDARHFLDQTDTRYDVIFLDAFDEEGPPRALRSVEWFSLLERHLLPGGIVISNVHYEPAALASRYMRSAAEVFPEIYAVDSPLNGAVVFSREPLSSSLIWEQRATYAVRYGLPVMDLLSPRLTPDIEDSRSYHDSDSP